MTDKAAIELAEATLDMVASRNSHPVLHVKRAYRSILEGPKEERFLQKLAQYQLRKRREHRTKTGQPPKERV